MWLLLISFMLSIVLRKILAIESSCDDTSLALVDSNYNVLWEKTASHLAILQKYGGVVPESVSREHLKAISPLLKDLQDFTALSAIDAICYTQGPGLAGSLLVGSTLAHSLALTLNKPLLPIHHLKGHFFSYLLQTKKPLEDCLSLIVSGGHTQILHVSKSGQFTILGQTRDDAVGEVFDKVAKHLNLGYPGGPKISQLAKDGKHTYKLTQPMIHSGDLSMSFSGLKSQTLRAWDDNPGNINDLCFSFEQTITQTLVKKIEFAIKHHDLPIKHFVLAGGVAANRTLRDKLLSVLNKNKIELIVPDPKWCTDNAAMIAAAAHFLYFHLDTPTPITDREFIKSNWSIEQ